jgi:hypothetical protein
MMLWFSRFQMEVSATPVMGPLTSGARMTCRNGVRYSRGFTVDQSVVVAASGQSTGLRMDTKLCASTFPLKHPPAKDAELLQKIIRFKSILLLNTEAHVHNHFHTSFPGLVP